VPLFVLAARSSLPPGTVECCCSVDVVFLKETASASIFPRYEVAEKEVDVIVEAEGV